jgi:hypothetical protein
MSNNPLTVYKFHWLPDSHPASTKTGQFFRFHNSSLLPKQMLEQFPRRPIVDQGEIRNLLNNAAQEAGVNPSGAAFRARILSRRSGALWNRYWEM